MATHASFLRSSGVDGSTIRLNSRKQLAAGGIREPFSAGTKGGAPSVFYVDGNVVSSGNGLSWLSAFKTLVEGLAAAHSYASTSGNRAWAHRPTVYCCGDNLVENLVILAEKTDIIGVGSASGYTKCYLDGKHVPVTTNCWGTRWHNMAFGSSVAGIFWTLTSVSGGIEFHNCYFSSRGPAHTIAIQATALGSMKVHDCTWEAANTGFSTAAIDILAGDAAQTEIKRNYIAGAIGIRINASTTTTAGNIVIDRNTIKSTTECITDSASVAVVTNNIMITAASTATTTDGYTFDLALAANNLLTGSSKTDQIPFISESE